MKDLLKLNEEQSSLAALSTGLDKDILLAKAAVESSFSDDTDTDKLTANLALLQTKHGSLLNAIRSTAEAIKQSIADGEAKEASKELSIRQGHVKSSLSALDDAVALQTKLAEKLAIVVAENKKANPSNQEVISSVRGVIGKLANQFNLMGSISMASTMAIPDSKKDLERLQNNLNGWR
jgi:hypothetical protein